MERDRLKKKLKKKAFRNMLLVGAGIAAIGILLFTFGTELLVKFSVLLTHNSKDTANTTEDLSYIAAPDLSPIETATNSAKINISGTSTVDKSKIKLYINAELKDTVTVTDKNEFTFKNVSLEEGDNEIKTKTVTENGKESDYSSAVNVLFSNKAPDLTIDFPQDGASYKENQMQLTGKTGAGAKVTVNGFWAIVDDKGNFSYRLKLQDGGNSIKIAATDSSGNKTEKEINVTYAP